MILFETSQVCSTLSEDLVWSGYNPHIFFFFFFIYYFFFLSDVSLVSFCLSSVYSQTLMVRMLKFLMT